MKYICADGCVIECDPEECPGDGSHFGWHHDHALVWHGDDPCAFSGDEIPHEKIGIGSVLHCTDIIGEARFVVLDFEMRDGELAAMARMVGGPNAPYVWVTPDDLRSDRWDVVKAVLP